MSKICDLCDEVVDNIFTCGICGCDVCKDCCDDNVYCKECFEEAYVPKHLHQRCPHDHPDARDE